jgi:hypothetical protein
MGGRWKCRLGKAEGKLTCNHLPVFWVFFFFLWWVGWDWSLHSGLCTCKASAVPLDSHPHLQSILLWLFWRWGCSNYLSQLILPISAFQSSYDYRHEPPVPVSPGFFVVVVVVFPNSILCLWVYLESIFSLHSHTKSYRWISLLLLFPCNCWRDKLSMTYNGQQEFDTWPPAPQGGLMSSVSLSA